jgi:hypothetical protein
LGALTAGLLWATQQESNSEQRDEVVKRMLKMKPKPHSSPNAAMKKPAKPFQKG